ncbi:hypothetical protein QW131_09065 [Roseibium salinum]|nr:hypothetical protein [Roseibium salinum]
MSLRSSLIDHAAAQAAMQPWIEMECIQLGQGKCLGALHSLELGNQRLVRECQETAVQKLGATPDNLCTISYCTLDPAFRFSEHGAGDADAIFFFCRRRPSSTFMFRPERRPLMSVSTRLNSWTLHAC